MIGPTDVTIRVHYMRPGVTGEVTDFVTFKCTPDKIPSDIESKAISSVSDATGTEPDDINIEEIEYRETK